MLFNKKTNKKNKKQIKSILISLLSIFLETLFILNYLEFKMKEIFQLHFTN